MPPKVELQHQGLYNGASDGASHGADEVEQGALSEAAGETSLVAKSEGIERPSAARPRRQKATGIAVQRDPR
jgi:hypothetical protein